MAESQKTEPLFTGEQNVQLDSKLRFSLPAHWRGALGETFAFGYNPRKKEMLAVPYSACENFAAAHRKVFEIIAPELEYGNLGADGRIQIPLRLRPAFKDVHDLTLEGQGAFVKLRVCDLQTALQNLTDAENFKADCVEVFEKGSDL